MLPRPLLTIFLLVFAIGSDAPAIPSSHITIVVINETTGKPIQGADVLIGVPIGNKNANRIRLKTNSSGSATFEFTNTAPDRFWVIWGVETEACPMTFLTGRVLTSGVVSKFDCGNLRQAFQYKELPEPGQLVIMARTVSLFERMLREL